MPEPIKKQPGRTRTAQTSFRLGADEKVRWDDACVLSGLTQRQLLMRLLDGRLIIIPGLKDAMIELHYQGINLNQAVKHAHQFAPEIESELKIAAQECRKIYERLEKYLNQIYEIVVV